MSNVFIHETACVDKGNGKIGNETKVWHFCHVMGDANIGDNCVLGQNCFVANSVEIGNNVKIQNNVSLYDGVIVEDNVFLGPSMVFTNVINPRSEILRKDEYRPTIIHNGATIGANATIVCGNNIGEYAFVAAGAVVTHSVKPYELVAGVPARRIGWMGKSGYRLVECAWIRKKEGRVSLTWYDTETKEFFQKYQGGIRPISKSEVQSILSALSETEVCLERTVGVFK